MGFIVGIDASRNRSGGARAHLIGLLTEADPHKYEIQEVHIWAFRALLKSVPERPWLVKHNPKGLEKALAQQLLWQATKLSREATAVGCDILFATDASTLCRFDPMVVMSQDMLPYEPGEMRRLGVGSRRVRHMILTIVQSRAMNAAKGVIFLTEHAAGAIQEALGPMPTRAIIPHGIDQRFREVPQPYRWPRGQDEPIKLLYVSNAAPYKHNWVVVRAAELLRSRGYNVRLRLVGGSVGGAQRLLDKQIARSDPHRLYVELVPFVAHELIPSILADAHVFVFASSCENMPVTLLEAMAVGLPIACSNRGPMPEILGDGGVYFDPEDFDSIAHALEQIIQDQDVRQKIASCAKSRSRDYSWRRCAAETFRFLAAVAKSQGRELAGDEPTVGTASNG